MPNDETAPIMVRIYDGTRKLLPEGINLLYRLLDGNKKQQYAKHVEKPVLRADVPFFDNLGDRYTVIVSADDYVQAGFYPVSLKPGVLTTVDLMLLPKDCQFNFRPALWDNLDQSHPELTQILGQGVEEAAARDRYTQLMEQQPDSLAAFLNMTTALEQVLFSATTALDYFKALIWDEPDAEISSDRFYAFADAALIGQLEIAAREGLLEDAPSALHPGATRSFKQVEFGEANLQFTLHEHDRKPIGGVDCVKIEIDMDYFKDTLAHLVLEVLVNQFGRNTDPRVIYVLRWMAGRRAGKPDFNPPHEIRAV